MALPNHLIPTIRLYVPKSWDDAQVRNHWNTDGPFYGAAEGKNLDRAIIALALEIDHWVCVDDTDREAVEQVNLDREAAHQRLTDLFDRATMIDRATVQAQGIGRVIFEDEHGLRLTLMLQAHHAQVGAERVA